MLKVSTYVWSDWDVDYDDTELYSRNVVGYGSDNNITKWITR